MITLAQGLTDPKAAGIISTYYTSRWNKLAWDKSVIADITSSAYFDELKKGDTCTIPIEPVVPIREFVEGANPDTDRVVPTTQTVVINQAFDFDVAVGPATQEMSYVDLLGAFQEGGRKSADKWLNEKVFTYLSGKAEASNNRGNTAGKKSSALVLGTQAAPVKIGPDTIIAYLLQFTTCMVEQGLVEGDIAVTLPALMEWVFLQSELKAVNVSGDDKSKLVTGYMGRLGRQKFYVTNFVEGAGTSADPFHIFAIMKPAVAYTMRLNRNRLWQHKNWDVSAQGLGVWGRGIIKDWAMAEGWVYIDTDAMPSLT